ncbi:GTP cyclohydrolase I FolE [Mollicutes bacterium LVI A0039]|nr:GTP cyclohydrolase I FolE [Mollicutes bacterium LVI A0039]
MNIDKTKQAVTDLLIAIGEDPNREGLVETPTRVAKAYAEILGSDLPDVESYFKTFEYEGNGVVMQSDIEFYSLCEHHMLPFFGKVHIAYLPNNKVIGLSKLSRIVEYYAKNLQLQERLTEQIASSLMTHLECRGVIVVIEAKHLCMSMRGVRQGNAITKSVVSKGIYAEDQNLRVELLSQLTN